MKKIVAFVFAAIMILAITSSFSTSPRTGSIKGMISPPNGAARVWAISKKDTAIGMIYQGMFLISELQPGTYSLQVEAIPPYKNERKEFVVVNEGQETDIGYILLKK
jgi:hypothetical protein